MGFVVWRIVRGESQKGHEFGSPSRVKRDQVAAASAIGGVGGGGGGAVIFKKGKVRNSLFF